MTAKAGYLVNFDTTLCGSVWSSGRMDVLADTLRHIRNTKEAPSGRRCSGQESQVGWNWCRGCMIFDALNYLKQKWFLPDGEKIYIVGKYDYAAIRLPCKPFRSKWTASSFSKVVRSGDLVNASDAEFVVIKWGALYEVKWWCFALGRPFKQNDKSMSLFQDLSNIRVYDSIRYTTSAKWLLQSQTSQSISHKTYLSAIRRGVTLLRAASAWIRTDEHEKKRRTTWKSSFEKNRW